MSNQTVRFAPLSPTTEERILTAAAEELSERGISGARVDRIARQARTSKERVYAYFRSKEELYARVASREMGIISEAVQLDPADLPAYAGQLFDYFTAHPDHFRLLGWARLELKAPSADQDHLMAGAIRAKIQQLRQAQEAGILSNQWEPAAVLALVNQLATTWMTQREIATAATKPRDRTDVLARQRKAVVAAVARIFPPSEQLGTRRKAGLKKLASSHPRR